MNEPLMMWWLYDHQGLFSNTALLIVLICCVAESLVKLKLVTRKKSNVTVGENVELMCLVRGLNVPATLTWSRQHNASTTETILTQYSNGSINWSGEQHHYQLKVQKTNEKEVINYLIINRATHREAGLYQCHVSVFLENVHKKLPPSNQLGVTVMNPGTVENYKARCLWSFTVGSSSCVFYCVKPCLLLL